MRNGITDLDNCICYFPIVVEIFSSKRLLLGSTWCRVFLVILWDDIIASLVIISGVTSFINP